MKKPIPFGKYYLLDRISVGGMAEVFKAKAYGVQGFERLIAVKRILPSIAEDEEFITMFIDEAKISVQLTHANIAQIFDLGKVGDSYFIAMEYVAGKDLRAIFDRMRKKSQAISPAMAAYTTMKICEGLDYAHNKKDSAGRDFNLVHRDVSPQNVLVSYDGDVKLIDFGIAKAAGKAGKTQAGILKGKFGYMSPEQVRGLPLDRRSDIFALGICLWEMVTGERLFVGESDFSTLEKVRNVEIVAPSSFNKRIPEDLEKIIFKALNKEVEERYQSAMDLHDDLQSWMYTSGNFFARKDLAAFQQEVFREEIEKEQELDEDYGDKLITGSVPPPPRASRMPAPPRVTSPAGPVPPRPGGAPGMPPRPTMPGESHGLPAPPSRPTMEMPGPPSAKRTMLGIPAPTAAPPHPGPPRPTATPPVPQPKPQAAPPAPGAVEMDWDDDEPPTNIYDKQTSAQMAKAAVAQAAAPPPMAPPRPSMPQAPPMPAQRNTGPMSPVAPSRANTLSDFDENSREIAVPRHRKNKNKSMLIGLSVGVIVALLLAVALFKIFIQKEPGSIEITVEPSDEISVVLDGTTPIPGNISPVTVDGLDSGEHSLIIRREGYEQKEIKVDIKPGKEITTKVVLSPSKASLAGFLLETDPPGCTVEVDGRIIDDKTPLTVPELSEGNHVVKLSRDKYTDLKFEVELKAGETVKLPLKKLIRSKIEVTFNTAPQGVEAVLIADGNRIEIGKTPAKYEIDTTKTYEVEYVCGGKSVKNALTEDQLAGGGDRVSLSAIACEGAAAVASTAVRTPAVKKPVSTSTEGGDPKPQTAKPQAGGGAEGYLSVQTRPWSQVSIDGKFIRNTPLLRHPLKPGKHTVTVENPGFNLKRQFTVTIKSGETTTLVQQLI